MTIYSVLDPEFKPYGKVLTGYDTLELMQAMEAIPLPEEGTAYRPGIESLEACSIFTELQDRQYGEFQQHARDQYLAGGTFSLFFIFRLLYRLFCKESAGICSHG